MWIRGMLLLCLGVATATAQPTALSSAFTYQGRLEQNGSPFNGTVGMRFLLYDSPTGSNTVGGWIPDPVAVQDGVFTVDLDFGAAAFNGDERWLEVIVEGQPLSPRQRIGATPYSLQTRGIFVDQDFNVGLGTASPQAKLHVEAPASDASVILPDNAIAAAEILDEPGQARSEVEQMIDLTNGLETSMVFAGLYCPTNGFVLAIGEAEMVNGLSVGQVPEIQFDVRPVGSNTLPERRFRIASSVGHRVRQSCVRVIPVTEGQQSFEFFGRSLNAEVAPGRAWNPELTLVFLPTQY